LDWGKEPTDKEGVLHTEKEGVIIYEKVHTLSGNYYDFFEGLYHSIIYNHQEPVTAEEGAKVMRIIEAVLTSSASKKVVVV
jgi:hypothetical protein